MTFYSTLITNRGLALHFRLEAESAHNAVQVLAAYCRGIKDGSPHEDPTTVEINSLSKSKTRGVEYRSL